MMGLVGFLVACGLGLVWGIWGFKVWGLVSWGFGVFRIEDFRLVVLGFKLSGLRRTVEVTGVRALANALNPVLKLFSSDALLEAFLLVRHAVPIKSSQQLPLLFLRALGCLLYKHSISRSKF